jgi:hypothetical protein
MLSPPSLPQKEIKEKGEKKKKNQKREKLIFTGLEHQSETSGYSLPEIK